MKRLYLLAVFLCLVCACCDFPSSPSPKHSPATVYVTKAGYWASLNRAKLEKLMDMVAANDKQACSSYLSENFDVFELKAGIRVHKVDTTWSGLVKLRIRGQTDEFWTVENAILPEPFSPPQIAQKEQKRVELPVPTAPPLGHNVVAAENIEGAMNLSVILIGPYKKPDLLKLGRQLKKKYAPKKKVQIEFYKSLDDVNSKDAVGSYTAKGVVEDLTLDFTREPEKESKEQP